MQAAERGDEGMTKGAGDRNRQGMERLSWEKSKQGGACGKYYLRHPWGSGGGRNSVEQAQVLPGAGASKQLVRMVALWDGGWGLALGTRSPWLASQPFF